MPDDHERTPPKNVYEALYDLMRYADYYEPEMYDDAAHRRNTKRTLRLGRAAVTLVPKIITALDDLVADLQESHQGEIDSRHHGDGPSCLYCRHLKAAKAVLKKAGVTHEPHWPLGERGPS